MFSQGETPLTRRALLRGSVTAAAAAAVVTVPAAVEAALPEPDPILEAWRTWRPLAEEYAGLLVERDRLEKDLPEWASLAGATWGRRRSSPTCYSMEMSDHLSTIGDAGHQEIMRMDRVNFAKRLRRAQAKAKAERDRIGLTAVKERLKIVVNLREPLSITIAESASTSPVAMAAKIDVSLSGATHEHPLAWTQYRTCCSIVRNLMPQLPTDMAATLEPIAAMKGKVRDAYLRGAGGAA